MRSALLLCLVASGLAGCGGADRPAATAGARETNESDLADPSRCFLNVGQKIAPITAARLGGGASVTFPGGKVTVVAFLSTWDRFTEKALPHLQRLQEKYGSRGVSIVDLDSERDDEGKVSEFWRTHRVSFPVVWEADRAIFAKLRASPVTVAVFDRAGVVRYVGPGDTSSEDIDPGALERAVEELVASPDSTIPSYAPSPCETKLGQKLRTMTAARLDAPGVTLAIPTGKWTLLAFVATWNMPAKQSIPALQAIADANAAQGLTVIAVVVDDEPSGVLDFIKRAGGSFPVVFDEGKQISRRLQPAAMPTFILLDSNGVVRHVERGYHDPLEAHFDQVFARLR